MVKRFFRNFRTEIQENLKPAARAQVLSENEEVSEDTIPLAILVEDDEFPIEEPYSPTPGEPETPADIPTPEPEAPGDIPRAEPVIPTVPGEDIPEAIPVKPEEPEAPTDLPKAEPVAPGDE